MAIPGDLFLFKILQQLSRKVRQLRTLSFFKCDMSVKRVIFEFVDYMRESVAVGIKIRCINLINIARKNDFGAFTCSGNNCFYFMRSQVLSFVDNKTNVR